MATRPRYRDPDDIDERYLVEWFEFGWAELLIYLRKHANFQAWCREHHREEPAS